MKRRAIIHEELIILKVLTILFNFAKQISVMIEITLAQINQIDIIQKIAYQTWPTTFKNILSPKQIDYMLNMMYSNEALTTQIAHLKHCFLLAKRDDEYLGFISFETQYKGAYETKIHKIYLLPSAQGLGVGKKLMEAVENTAKKNGSLKLLLNVNKFNKAALFYHKLGFQVIGTENIDIGNGYLMEDKIMEKLLKKYH